MLRIHGASHRFCDGVSRRSFLQIGGLGIAGLSLANLMQAEALATNGAARSTISKNPKSIIQIFLAGGIGHQDTVDLKPEAPKEIRGEFNPIATNIPGIQLCELMPRMAKMMDKFSIIRSISDSRDEHSADHCLSGYPGSVRKRTEQPSMGAVIAKVLGPTSRVIPPYMGLTKMCGHRPWADCGEPGVLGRAYGPARPDGEDMTAMALKDVTLDQLQNRRKLLASFDHYRRGIDQTQAAGMDSIYQQAFDVLTSNKLLDAMNLDKEDPRTLDRYGRGSDKNVDDGPPVWNDQILIARRLIEVGVRCVTLGYGRWDYHNNNFGQMKERLPLLDQGISALVSDLHEKGLDKDVTVIVWGEFGRTPKINGAGGRDHWARANSAIIAGGGLKMGQQIGSTTKDAAEPLDRPVKYQEIFATLYHAMGIDPHSFIRDASERPIKLLDQNCDAMHELV